MYKSRVVKRTYKKPPATAKSLLLSLKVKPGLYSPQSLSSNYSSLSAPSTPSSYISSSALFLTYLNSSRVSPKEPRSPGSNALDRFEPPAPRERSISEMKLVPFREESPKLHQPTFSLLQSLRFLSAIPRQLHTPLSLLDPEHFQISDATSSEIDYKLCAFTFFWVLYADIAGADLFRSVALWRYCE